MREWYRQRSVRAAAGFDDVIAAAVTMLAENPSLGALWLGLPARQGVRRWTLRRYPFCLFYRVDPSRVVVLAVAHTSRRPGYWSTRAAE